MRQLLLLLIIAAPLRAQSAPASFRLVTPKGPGSIAISTAGGWAVERFALYDNATRAVLLLQNKSLGIVASYILSNDETFDYSKESCKSDVLGPIVQGTLKNATLKNLRNATRSLPGGQTLDMGSYLIVKNEGITLNQQNVFGFIAQGHTCAEIHLSRTPFKEGEEHLFDPALDGFRFDPAYTPSASDYTTMAGLLPPGMAAAYKHPETSDDAAKTPAALHGTGQSLDFALPNHPGALHMDAPGFEITELSAKPNGSELGIRAVDKQGIRVLGFLFIPQPAQRTAIACRDWMLGMEQNDLKDSRKMLGQNTMKSASGVDIAIADFEQSKTSSPGRYMRRAFMAQNGLCADIQLTYPLASFATLGDSLLHSLTFDPNQDPDFTARFRYATILYDHHAYAAAAPVFVSALAIVDTVPEATKWRRVTTDQASMAYGIAGDLNKSRALNQAAIVKDPDYPLYYYNLACADAESGNAKDARIHLQQASDRRANTLPGEPFPDPSKDDSILKLKSDTAFWAFVQSLPKP